MLNINFWKQTTKAFLTRTKYWPITKRWPFLTKVSQTTRLPVSLRQPIVFFIRMRMREQVNLDRVIKEQALIWANNSTKNSTTVLYDFSAALPIKIKPLPPFREVLETFLNGRLEFAEFLVLYVEFLPRQYKHESCYYFKGDYKWSTRRIKPALNTLAVW